MSSARAKHHMVMLTVGVLLTVLGVGLLVQPFVSALFVSPLASLPYPSGSTTDPYAVTVHMDNLYASGSNVQYQVTSKICGPNNGLNDASYLTQSGNTCFNHNPPLVGDYKDPWSVYDLGTIPPNTFVYATGYVKNYYTGAAIPNIQVDVSWYYAAQQANGFTVFQVQSPQTDSNGNFQTQAFAIPQQAYGQKIVYFAETVKNAQTPPAFSAWYCPKPGVTMDSDPTITSSALCFGQSEHYQVLVGTPPPTQSLLSIWVGQCTYSTTLPTSGGSCVQVWKDGQDITGATEVPVTLPFEIIAAATQGPDPSAIYVHARPYPVGSPNIYTEQPSFPAPMGHSLQTTINGAQRNVYVLYVGPANCPIGGGSGPPACDVQIPTGRYDFEFSNSATAPWNLSVISASTVVFAVLQIGGGTVNLPNLPSASSIPLQSIAGVILILAGIVTVGMVMARKHP